jgi:hypothetical protein
MARGESGRIVLEIDPSEKKELYAALTRDGMTLKDWFLRSATDYLRERGQGQLFAPMVLAENPVSYRAGQGGAAKGKVGKSKKKEKGQ